VALLVRLAASRCKLDRAYAQITKPMAASVSERMFILENPGLTPQTLAPCWLTAIPHMQFPAIWRRSNSRAR
jgi:hypothetical protein